MQEKNLTSTKTEYIHDFKSIIQSLQVNSFLIFVTGLMKSVSSEVL